MIDFALKYQAVIFASVEEITPTSDNLTYFINAFKDKGLIPSTFQELSQTGMKSRFGLKSSDEVWNIEFSGNRIDIIKTNNDIGNIKMGDLNEFVDDVQSALDIIFDKFPFKSNRVSIVSNYFLKKMNEDELNDAFDKIFNPIPLYKENPPITWNQRYVSRMERKFADKTELLNVISDINRVNGSLKINSKIKNIDRIELSFDFNTFQGNSEYRFNKEDMKDFYKNILELEKSTKEDCIKIFEKQ